MDTQQLSVLQVAKTPSAASRSTTGVTSTGQGEAESQPQVFKDHLEQQLEHQLEQQVEAPVESEYLQKTVDNQQDKTMHESPASTLLMNNEDALVMTAEQQAIMLDSRISTALSSQPDSPEPGLPELDSSAELVIPGLATDMPSQNAGLPLGGNALPQDHIPQLSQSPAQIVSRGLPFKAASDTTVMTGSQPVITGQATGIQQAVLAQASIVQAQSESTDVPVTQYIAPVLKPVVAALEGGLRQAEGKPALDAIFSQLSATQVLNQASLQQRVPELNQTMSPQLSVFNATPVMDSPLMANAQTGLSIPASLGTTQWSQQMSEQVSMMLRNGQQVAEIRLNPAHLGPMEIRLTVNDDQASVNFIAQHAPVRDAIDQALPRLRDMLEQQGLNLADVDVATHSDTQQQQAEEYSAQGSDDGEVVTDKQGETQGDVVQRVIDSGLSLYA